MFYVGIAIHATVKALYLRSEDDTRLRLHLPIREISELLSILKNQVRLAVIEDGFRHESDSLLDVLRSHRVPFITVRPDEWREELNCADIEGNNWNVMQGTVKPLLDSPSDAEISASATASALALYAEEVTVIRDDSDSTEGAFEVGTSLEKNLFRFWPQFQQDGMPPLYVELVRQLTPSERAYTQDETVSNAGMRAGSFIYEAQALQALGLIRAADPFYITVLAPWESRFYADFEHTALVDPMPNLLRENAERWMLSRIERDPLRSSKPRSQETDLMEAHRSEDDRN